MEAVLYVVRIGAIVPFFSGTSSATHSKEDTRFEYLRQTLKSLKAVGMVPVVFVVKSDPVRPAGLASVVELDVDPIWLPHAACTYAQSWEQIDLVYYTEADQILHVADNAVWGIPNKSRYVAPWRLDLEGPNGEVELEGCERYVIAGKRYGVANGAHHLVANFAEGPFDVLPIHANQQAFAGAYLCTLEYFRRIPLRKRTLLPVEHASGFDANSIGQCVKTASLERMYVDHLSPRDRWASSTS